MDAKTNPSKDAQGLRLIRAFLSLPPEQRVEVIAFVEELARTHGRREEGQETSPR